MNRGVMNRGARIAQAISDRTNPVVVKELRQAVQSRLVIAILLLFLLANVLIVSGYLILSVDATTSERAGQDLFSALFVVLVVTCMIFVPLYAAIRLTMERNDSNIDLLFITTIAPAAIIRGKFWATVALTGLIYSASMPFLTFTYLLRGIDLPSIFFSLVIAFSLTAITIMLAIFVGSVSGGLLLRIIMFGGLLNVGGTMMVWSIMAGLTSVQMGLASIFAANEAWTVCGVFTLLGLSAWGLFYLLAVAAVSPRSSNRMFPIRVFLTASWLIFGVIAGLCGWYYKDDDPVVIWVIVSVALLSVTLCFVLAERESWTARVRRYIPRGNPQRLLAWLFFTGAAGGVLWCFAMGAATLLAGWSMIFNLPPIPGLPGAKEEPLVMLGVLLFAWCYSMAGLFLRRMLVPKSVPLVGTTIGLALLAIGGTMPLLLAYLIHGAHWQFDSLAVYFVVANPFVLQRSGTDRVFVYCVLVICSILGLLVNIPWFSQQWQAFHRHDPKPIPPSAALAQEPPVVHA